MLPYAFIPTPPDTAAPGYRRKARPTPLLLEEIAPSPIVKPQANLPPPLVTFTPSHQNREKASTPAVKTVVRQTGHVWFNSPVNSIHVVTPYSQVYGIHPKYFHFDADGSLQPTPKAEAGQLGARGLEIASKISNGQIISSRAPVIFAETRTDCPPTARGDAAVVWNIEASNLCSSPVSLQTCVDVDKKLRRHARQKPSEAKFYSSPAAIASRPQVAEVPAPCSSPTDNAFFKGEVEKSAALLAQAVAHLSSSPRSDGKY